MAFVKLVMSGKNIQTYSSNFNVLDVGGGSGERARTEFYPGAEITILDLKHGWDVMQFGLPDGDWDAILANHFIEHISSPDFFLDECRRVMKSHTVLNIGTPNLAAWYNRILFLFGYVPNHVELSKRYNVGKPFDWNKVELGGHIFVYTVPALIELLKHHGFKISGVAGELSSFKCHPLLKGADGLMTKLSPTLASAFRIKCTR